MKALGKNQRIYSCFSFLGILLLLISLLSCSGSDTRSQAKSSTSSEFNINIQITSPVDGAVVAFTSKSEGAEPTADVAFTTAVTGGTEPITVTWLIQGPTTSNSSTGGESDTVLTFQESGIHTITAIATDARGFTDQDSITIIIQTGSGTTTPLDVTITSPVDGATVTFVNGSSNVTFTAATNGGVGTVTVTWIIQGPTTSNSATGLTPTLTFLETGVHTITVTATDSEGTQASETITITVETGTSI